MISRHQKQGKGIMAWRHLLLAFLALKCINLAMTQVFRSECRRNAAFVATDRGKALSNTSAGVLQTFQSVSYLLCGMRCTANNNCKSLNFKDAVESVCEILSFNKATPGATMKSSPGWTHYEPGNQVGLRCHQVVCDTGYKCIESCSNKMGYECSDIDECKSGSHDCHQHAICTNNNGSFSCRCKSGFTGHGKNCSDIDECKSDSHDCHQHAICTNNNGSFSCQCKSGFTGHGKNCSAENIAYKKPSSSSSVHTFQGHTLPASLGNDGDRTGDWQRCSWTKADNMPWWQVDLTKQAAVSSVRIKSGVTFGQLKINPFLISVGDDSSNGGRNNALCVDGGILNAGEFKYFTCPTVLHGRYVTVFLNRIENLQICEIEVYENWHTLTQQSLSPMYSWG